VASIDSTATKEELTRTGLDAQLGLARALARQGKLDEAARELEDLLTKAPKSGMVLAELGGVLAKQGKLDAALANLDEAISLSPRTPSIHVKRIAALADAKKCKQAKSAYGALLELKPPDDAAQAAKQALGRCK
jgi:Flp pilus assembly protein TadD